MRGNNHLVLLMAVSACRLVCGLAVIKALSWFLGPAQFGTVSQLNAVCMVFYTFAGGAVNNGLVVQAGGEPNADIRNRWLATALAIGFGASLLLASLAAILYLTGSELLFGTDAIKTAFIGIACTQVIIGVGNILLSYASGTRDVKSFATAQIVGTLAWAALTVAATMGFGYNGAIWAIVLAPACSSVVIIILYQARLRAVWSLVGVFDSVRTTKLLQASGLLILAICALPIGQTIVRADLAARNSWYDVGIWQSVVRLSDAYMQVFGVLAVHLLLPRLLQHNNLAARRVVLVKIGAIMITLFVLGSIVLYLIRVPVIQLAYSAEFLPAVAYIAPQLGADFAKVLAWILVYWFVAAGILSAQPAAEILQAVCFVVFYWLLWPLQGAMAPVYSHLLSCVVLLIAVGLATWRFKVK